MAVENFNSFCYRDGREFEDLVIAYEIKNNNSELIERNLYLPDAGVEVDAVMYDPTLGLVKYIQAKGGRPGEGRRVGGERTDNVKKATGDGSLIKVDNPNQFYTVYFSAKPKEDSHSDVMIKTGQRGNILNQVIYLGY
jgi:hypothetical protein